MEILEIPAYVLTIGVLNFIGFFITIQILILDEASVMYFREKNRVRMLSKQKNKFREAIIDPPWRECCRNINNITNGDI